MSKEIKQLLKDARIDLGEKRDVDAIQKCMVSFINNQNINMKKSVLIRIHILACARIG